MEGIGGVCFRYLAFDGGAGAINFGACDINFGVHKPLGDHVDHGETKKKHHHH